MASSKSDSDPVHLTGTIPSTLPNYTTIATFPPGTFLENLAVRRDGSILASDMLTGQIWYVDPRAEDPQASVKLVWKFGEDESSSSLNDKDIKHAEDGGLADKLGEGEGEEEDSHGMYSSTAAAEAIVESPVEPDVFYITSGIHGKQGTWNIYSLDMRSYDPSSQGQRHVKRLASIPTATWLNGGTAIPHPTRPLILMAESYQGSLYAYDIHSGTVSLWLSHRLLGKITTRPPWPAVNGVKYHETSADADGKGQGYVYFTNSDRAVLGRIKVDRNTGRPASRASGAEDDVSILATGCAGDDLCLDDEGNVYVTTNPMNTLLKFPGQAPVPAAGSFTSGSQEQETQRQILLGIRQPSQSEPGKTEQQPEFNPETVGPTAVAFGRTSSDAGDLYVVTCGGIIHPLEGEVREARILKVESIRSPL